VIAGSWQQFPIEFAADGQPIIGPDIPCDAIEQNGELYMERYYLQRSKALSVRLHHLLTDDLMRHPHDHPWDFASLLLTGGYRETTPEGSADYWAPCIVSRPAEQLHSLELLAGPMWTYVVTGPLRRRWGFQTEQGWVYWREYEIVGEPVPDFC
jgi:hypothetical protein